VSVLAKAREELKRHFGFDQFREGQGEVIQAVLEGRDSMVVMPTGGGKSLCYQLPALMIDGVTLVVSPLIALMKDQVDALASRGIAATFINSSLSFAETSQRLAAVRQGRCKLLYVAPERFRSEAFTKAIAEANVKLLAVDEAHCISHWGHDFRPDYLKLKDASERLGRPQTLALTATATPRVRDDIKRQLSLGDARIFIAGFDRPNLALRVLHPGTEKEKLAALKQIISGSPGSGIVYTATRRSVEQLTAKLKMAGLQAEAYHAGMNEAERTRAQESFMSGRSRAIVATNAFGMGIDKPDIRFVVHYHLPGSIEAYYQEIGRAGRDGLPAECALLFNYADTRTQQFFIDGNHPSPDLIESVYRVIYSMGADAVEITAGEIASQLGTKNDMSVRSALQVLEKAGHVALGRAAGSRVAVSMTKSLDDALAALPGESIEAELLRDLILVRDVNDRGPTEISLGSVGADIAASEAQVLRALNLLATRGVMSYRNVYSGHGVGLLDAAPAAELRIDRKELATRAAAEQGKLRRMIEYCYHKGCLRRFILSYFGDPKQLSRCGSCSSCAPDWRPPAANVGREKRAKPGGTLTVRTAGAVGKTTQSDLPEEWRATEAQPPRPRKTPTAMASGTPSEGADARSINEAEEVVVKKILSCVARLNDRFGKGTIAAVLRGARSQQVAQHKLDRLSTYSLLKEMSQDEIIQFIRALIQADCIAANAGAYPTLRLTDQGREVMLGRAAVRLALE
jgi:ATP-dependent DNA helicase RecQ